MKQKLGPNEKVILSRPLTDVRPPIYIPDHTSLEIIPRDVSMALEEHFSVHDTVYISHQPA